MPDLSVNISELPVSPAMTDDGLLVVYQNSTTNSIQGALIKSYAQQAVASQVTAAQQSATQAQTSATQAQSSQQAAATAQSGAQAAKTAAEASQAAAEAAQGKAGQGATAAAQAQTEAQQAATTATQRAQAAQTAASEAETASGSAQGYASTAQGAAQTAQTQAQAAQSAANEAETSAAAAANSEDTALTAAQNAQAAQEAIENLGVSAQGLPEGSQPEVTKSVIEGIVSLTFKIPAGATGPQGPEGPQGVSVDRVEKTSGTGEPGTTDTYTIYLTDGSSYPFQVLNGPQGPQGNGLTIKYTYDTLEELDAAVPSPERGMNAYIGASEPYDVYTYTQTTSGNRWINGGPLQGPAGATGPAGVGISSINRTGGTGAAGSLDTYTVTMSDGSSYQFTVQNGANGADGQSAYEAAQAGGYTGPESQFNADLAGVSSKQRVVDFTDLSVTGPDSNFMYTILLTSEDKQQLFSDENPPILLFSLYGGIIVPFLAGRYSMEQQVLTGFSAAPYGTYGEGPFGFVFSTCCVSDDTIYINANPEFFVDRNLVVFTVPVQLPSDPTQPLEAATKQYVDNLVGTINTTLDTINGEVV